MFELLGFLGATRLEVVEGLGVEVEELLVEADELVVGVEGLLEVDKFEVERNELAFMGFGEGLGGVLLPLLFVGVEGEADSASAEDAGLIQEWPDFHLFEGSLSEYDRIKGFEGVVGLARELVVAREPRVGE